MVLSGLSFQRALLSAISAILCFGSMVCLKAAEPAEIAGTMPEDYLPELKIILAQALKRSPEILAKEFERQSQEARFTIVKSARLPSLGGSISYGVTQTATASNTSSQYRDSGFQYNFGLGQALFHWGAIKNQVDSARISLLVTDKNFAVAYRELSVALRKAYLALVVEKALVRQAREARRLVEADVAVAKVKKEDGAISGATLASEELRLRVSEFEVKRVENDFMTNRARFARLAGLPDLPEEAIPAEIPRPNFSEARAAAMTAALLRDNAKSTIEYEIYELRLRDARLRQKNENTRLLPKFGVNAGYSLQNTTNVNGNIAEQRAVTQQSIGIGGSWNIFDGFATSGAKKDALVARRALEYRKTIEIEQLLQNAQTLERTLRIDAEQLDLAEVRHANALEGHRLVTEEVSFGRLPKADINRAQMNILLYEAKNIEARAAFLSHWSDFVAVAASDPVLNNLSERHVRKKN